MCFVNIVSLSIAHLSIFLMVFFSVISFYFDEVRPSMFSFIDYGFSVVVKKSLPNPKSQKFSHIFLVLLLHESLRSHFCTWISSFFSTICWTDYTFPKNCLGSFLLLGVCWASPSLCCACKCSLTSWNTPRVPLICLPALRNHCPLLPFVQYLKTIVYIILSSFLAD